MINNTFKAFLLIAILFVSFALANQANATVGGPTLIHTFSYNPADESVYFIKEDYGGRGCPPVLSKISLATGSTSEVFSCEQGSELLNQNNTYDSNIVYNEINKITQDFKYLSQINLNTNNIEIDARFSRSENYSPEFDEILKRYFSIDIYQNKNKIDSFEVSGCSMDQPFTFAGYSIPGFEKKIVLLSSAKDNCFEGGYIKEDLYVISNISELDKAPASNSIKGKSALSPNEGTLVIFESGEIEMKNTEEDMNKNDTDEYGENNFFKNISLTHILVAVVLLLIGVVMGMWSRKKNNNLS